MADPKEGVEFLRLVAEAESTNRVEGIEDLKFRFGDQWPTEIQNSRTLESRPCLTINETDAYCRQVENQQRQQRPRIKVHAVDDIADPKIAKVISGLCRHIEVNSDADWAYDTAFMFADTIGWGYMRMRTDYIREDSFDQDIFIDPVENPFTVYFDPNSSLPDGSDAERVLVTDLIRKESFRKMFPGAQEQSFEERAGGDSDQDWVTEHDIRVAEYFYCEREKQKLVMLTNGQALWADQIDPALLQASGLAVMGDRPSQRRVIKWCKQTTFEILETKVIPGRYIPVIPVYGSSYMDNGRRIRFGLVRFAKDPQRMVNFWQTAQTESIALAPKAKWLLEEGQDEGFENEWAQANIAARPVLHWKRTNTDGKPGEKPERIAPEPPPAGAIQAAMMASQNLSRVLGIYDPGVTQSRMHKSDKTINAEDQQTDQSNFHYYDNLTRSIKHVGRIALGWFPTTYDTQRVMRIIGDDGRPDTVTINEKKKDETGAIQEVLNNVTIGNYDVVMDTGPGYNSKRQESVRILTELLATPLGEKIAAVADDVIVRQMDFNGADVVADRLAAANPLAQIDDKSEIPPQVQMKMAAQDDMIKKLQAALQEAGLTIKYRSDIEKMKQEGETRRALMKETSDAHEREITQKQKQHDTETYALTAQNVAEINGLVKLLTSKTEHGQRLREMLLEFEHQTQLQDKQLAAKSQETETLQ